MTAVIWIDWYSYHVSRFRALLESGEFNGGVAGIELVGGCGVHDGLNFREKERSGLPIASLLPESDWREAGQFRLAGMIWNKLQQLRPSAVLIPGYYTAPAVAAAAWARLHGKRSILMTETTRSDHRRAWWKETVKRFVIHGLFDGAIAGGKPHLRYLRELGFAPEQLARFYDTVDNRFYEDGAGAARCTPGLRQSLGLPERYFLYTGRLAAEKNVDGLVNAFARYRRQGGTWSLVLVGDGPERSRLEQQCTALGIAEQVAFAGFKSSNETPAYYGLAACFVLPSTREPWGLVVNEAMASGLPVIVSRRCGCAEDLISPGENGFLFDPVRPDEILRCLLAITAMEPDALAAMGGKSRQIVAGYSPRHWAAEVARIVK